MLATCPKFRDDWWGRGLTWKQASQNYRSNQRAAAKTGQPPPPPVEVAEDFLFQPPPGFVAEFNARFELAGVSASSTRREAPAGAGVTGQASAPSTAAASAADTVTSASETVHGPAGFPAAAQAYRRRPVQVAGNTPLAGWRRTFEEAWDQGWRPEVTFWVHALSDEDCPQPAASCLNFPNPGGRNSHDGRHPTVFEHIFFHGSIWGVVGRAFHALGTLTACQRWDEEGRSQWAVFRLLNLFNVFFFCSAGYDAEPDHRG